MNKESILIFLGICIIIVTFLGIPALFRTILFVILGSLISLIALLIYARERLLAQKKIARKHKKSTNTDTHETSEELEE